MEIMVMYKWSVGWAVSFAQVERKWED